MKKSSITLSIAIASTLSASVYIVPADIDGYKTKTDQEFYDMYQNQDSVIANGANGQLKTLVRNVDTSNKIATGNTLSTAAQTSVAGVAVRADTRGSFTLNGHRYEITTARNGNPILTGFLADGKGHIKYTGANVTNVRSQSCSVGGKYGCSQLTRAADETYFDLPTGTLATNTVTQKRDYACGKYGCFPVNQWYTSNLINIDKRQVGIAQLLNSRDISTRALVVHGGSTIHGDNGNNGKFA